MKVKTLIKILSTLNPELNVVLAYNPNDYFEKHESIFREDFEIDIESVFVNNEQPDKRVILTDANCLDEDYLAYIETAGYKDEV